MRYERAAWEHPPGERWPRHSGRSGRVATPTRPHFVAKITARSTASNPNLRPGPCSRISPPDEREDSIDR